MSIKETMLNNEKYLSEYATLDKDAIRFRKEDLSEDIRPNYYHDTDRIIYSLSYTRYIDKTQVFSNKQNDHISKRMIHVQFVSKIARTIGRALGLNEDLIEAMALGHDIGHVPFGHLGEKYLNEISLKYHEGYFMHNVQSVREFMNLEKNGKGLNLTIQVLDGILCHNGEFVMDKYAPKKKTKDEFLKDYLMCYRDPKASSSLTPMTLEGCVVRISDVIGYLGRDIEDAVRLGVLDRSIIPDNIKSILGDENKSIVNTIINDIITNSYGKNYITMSPEIYQAIQDLKKFNYEHIYDLAMTQEEKDNVELMFNQLFEVLYNKLIEEDTTNDIYTVYLNKMTDEYSLYSPARKVIDYIAGMTDEYFIEQYNKYCNNKKKTL